MNCNERLGVLDYNFSEEVGVTFCFTQVRDFV